MKKLNYTEFLIFLHYYIYKCKLKNNSPTPQIIDFINKIKNEMKCKIAVVYVTFSMSCMS